jgi:LPXTG-motif cell wall-anchored protein
VSTNTTSLRRVVTFISGVAVGLSLLTGVASAASASSKSQGQSQGQGNAAHSSANPDNQSPQPASTADYSGHGANVHGSYDSTRDGSPSGNGNGGGQAKGKPCAGCVGKADNKNPKGQAPDGPTDNNRGYECDGNHGIGRSNPAHTGCTTASSSGGSDVSGTTDTGDHGGTAGNPSAGSTDTPAKPACGDGQMTTDVNGDGVIDGSDCTQVEGLSLVRADPAAATAARNASAVLAESARSFTVMDANHARGITTLPRTGFDPTMAVFAGLALLGAGFLLVRKGVPAHR